MTPPLRPPLALFFKDVIRDSAKQVMKREAVSQLAESVRREFLRTVAENYMMEVRHNISQYVLSIEAMDVEISSDNYGEKLYTSLQKSLKDLEFELEKQGPTSPVVQYLQKKYGRQENSVVGRQVQPVYSLFSEPKDTEKPWLTRIVDDSPEIGEILAIEAARLFDRVFTFPEVS
jgi:hypothetical protein